MFCFLEITDLLCRQFLSKTIPDRSNLKKHPWLKRQKEKNEIPFPFTTLHCQTSLSITYCFATFQPTKLVNIYLLKSNKHTKKLWNMFKVNNTITRATSITSLWCFYFYLRTCFTPFSIVSIVDFEQLNVSWEFWLLLRSSNP